MSVNEVGSDRIIFEWGQDVYKVARSRPFRAGGEVLRIVSTYGLRPAIRSLEMGPDIYQSPKWELLHGVVANRRENALAARYPQLVLGTTSFLGGLINKQPYVQTLDKFDGSREFILGAFKEKVGRGLPRLGHMLEKPSNFGIDPVDDAVKFVDGGSSGLEEMLDRDQGVQDILSALENVRHALNEVRKIF